MNRKIILDDIKPGFIYKEEEGWFLLILKEVNKYEVILYCLNKSRIVGFPILKKDIVNYINNKEIIYVK